MRWSDLSAIAALVALTGCSAGAPEPSAFPSRPVDVAIAGLDPCTVFTGSQQSALGLRKATPAQAVVNGRPSTGCVWLGRTDIGYNTQTIPVGAEVALSEPAGVVVRVNGFGAVRNVVRELTGGAPTCQVTIDAAPGQSIRVQAQADLPNHTEDEMCRLATAASSMVMTTVATQG